MTIQKDGRTDYRTKVVELQIRDKVDMASKRREGRISRREGEEERRREERSKRE